MVKTEKKCLNALANVGMVYYLHSFNSKTVTARWTLFFSELHVSQFCDRLQLAFFGIRCFGIHGDHLDKKKRNKNRFSTFIVIGTDILINTKTTFIEHALTLRYRSCRAEEFFTSDSRNVRVPILMSMTLGSRKPYSKSCSSMNVCPLYSTSL